MFPEYQPFIHNLHYPVDTANAAQCIYCLFRMQVYLCVILSIYVT